MKRKTKLIDCSYCNRFGLCKEVKQNRWMCLDVLPCMDRQAALCRAYASGFVANTKDEIDGGLVPVARDAE